MKRVLIVDDDPNICDLLEARLKSSGYDVATANNGVAAFIKAAEERPDVIILDVNMPVMDGLKFVQATRGFEMKNIPIIVLTALRDTEETFNALKVTHFLSKPFDQKELLDMVADCVNKY